MSSAVILEVSSISKGYLVLDQCLKAAKVHVVEASAIAPGKFLIILKGDLSEIEKALAKAHALAKENLIDSCLLPTCSTEIMDALYGLSKLEAPAHGVIVLETTTLSSMLLGLHMTAAKHPISVIEVRSGRGINGKSTAFFFAAPDIMSECLDVFLRSNKARGVDAQGHVISHPHKDFLSFFNISGQN